MKLIRLGVLLLLPLGLRPAGTHSGQTACPASGAKQVLSTPSAAFDYTVQSPYTSLGNIAIGQSNVTTTTGILLVPGGSKHEGSSAPIYNLAGVYFACTNSADSLNFTYDQ